MTTERPVPETLKDIRIARGPEDLYGPFYTEIGRLVAYWADFEFLFDKILYEIWKLEYGEPKPTHFKISFKKRCEYWRIIAERKLSNDKPKLNRLLKLISKAQTLRDRRDLLIHGGPYNLGSDSVHWYVVEFGSKPKLRGEPMPLEKIKEVNQQITNAYKELILLDRSALRFPVTWLGTRNILEKPRKGHRPPAKNRKP